MIFSRFTYVYNKFSLVCVCIYADCPIIVLYTHIHSFLRFHSKMENNAGPI